MALSEADFERIGKLIDNAVSRRIEQFEQTYNTGHIALIQEMQASEKRLREEMQAMEKRLQSQISPLVEDVAMIKADVAMLKTDVATLKTDVTTLKTDVATLKTDVATLQTKLADVQQWVSRIFNEHGIALGKISDTIDGLYRRDFTLDQRLSIVEGWMRMRQLPPNP